MEALTLTAPSSAELLHVPSDVTLRSQLVHLLRTGLVTEFPVNCGWETVCQLSPDEAADLLLSAGSPWTRDPWWSPEVRPLLVEAVRHGSHVTSRGLLARLQTLQLPRQNISALGDQLTGLSRLTALSLACNELTSVRGADLPRSLRTLQLYGNQLGDLRDLTSGCPPLQRLALGRVQLTDDGLQELAVILSGSLSSLRVLDLCDNDIRGPAAVTALITAVPNIRSLTLSGNPAFLATGYYQQFLAQSGRLRVLDEEELDEAALVALADQLREADEAPEPSAKKTPAKKKPPKKSARRPAPDLDPARFEPCLHSGLIRVTGLIYLPFVPRDQWPGLELCVVFQWGSTQVSPPSTSPLPGQEDAAGGAAADESNALGPLEALLLDRSDVTVLETPLEWYCSDLRRLRDAVLAGLRVEILRREKWSPKKIKKGKTKDPKKESKKDDKKRSGEQDGKKNKKTVEKGAKKKTKDTSEKAVKGKIKSMGKEGKHADDERPPEDDDRPPPETSLGAVLLPLRGLLRPTAPLLLYGTASDAAAPAAFTDTHWADAIQAIKDEKKERKSAMKKAAKEDKKETKKKKNSSLTRSGSSKKKSAAPEPTPTIQCYFAVELYRKPVIKTTAANITHLPIDNIA
ncbi:uncharacterized protein LOC119103372 [Pollicipes pollicipes]|uniref:uncharacterized protein LOC119103372 n=1 Tax=Pollicipes pollicipes TaxID=41117 RepID=UPI001884F03F|nr:uncharacterized protein LOC119103372 [Pollicipes pollicipes]